MSETIEIGVARRNDASSDIPEVDYAAIKTKTSRFTNSKKQKFNILDIDARNGEPGPTILTSTAFNYRFQPLYIAVMTTLAVQSGARVVSSEIPGITIDLDDPLHTTGDFQTPAQTMLALSGDYDPLGTEQIKAMYEVGELSEDDEYHFVGVSFGACAVVAMARALSKRKLFAKKFNVTEMDLIDPVNAFGNHTIVRQAQLLYNLATTEDQRRQLYLAENEAGGYGDGGKEFTKISPDASKHDKHVKLRQIVATYATGIGLRKGLHTTLADALRDAPELRNMHVTLSRANDSSVCRDSDLQSAAETIRQSGGRADVQTLVGKQGEKIPIGHHVLDSISRYGSFAKARCERLS